MKPWQILLLCIASIGVGAEGTRWLQPPTRALAPPTTPTAASLEAKERAQRLVQSALWTRVWGREQAEALRRFAAQMTAEQRTQVLTQLVPAINRGDVKVSSWPPL